MRTKVAIIGGGPSGLLLSLLLHQGGIDNVVLERKTREVVLGRVRAGVLEEGVVALIEAAGASDLLRKHALRHDGTVIYDGASAFRIDFAGISGQSVFVYGQQDLTRDLYDRHAEIGGQIIFNAENLAIHDAKSDSPFVTWTSEAQGAMQLRADFVAGCDGFHGVSRRTIPDMVRHEYEKVLPAAWLGVLSQTPPVHHELIYAASARGFALCSMRHHNLSRYYIQCAATDLAEDWSDEAFWSELKRRIPGEFAAKLVIGPSIEKSVVPLRAFVCEPMQWGRLFLCGDAAHIVPPTGAKGLNAAAADVADLSMALCQFYASGEQSGLEGYSATALARAWKIVRFSLWFTGLLHRFPGQSPFDLNLQRADLAQLRDHAAMQKIMSDSYVGLVR